MLSWILHGFKLSNVRQAGGRYQNKSADFNFLVNRSGYTDYASKIGIANGQIHRRVEHIHRNYNAFREEMHRIRLQVEQGNLLYRALVRPRGNLGVDPGKDITFHYVVIGGREQNEVEESRERYSYRQSTHPPVRIEFWDSWLRKLPLVSPIR